MAGGANVIVSPLPAAHTVVGGGGYCSGGTGVAVSLDGSNTGVSYQLWNGGLPAGPAMVGTGLPLNFGLQNDGWCLYSCGNKHGYRLQRHDVR